MPELPLLSIVVLSWNHLELTQACVASLRAGTDVEYELVIVDNGSDRATADWVSHAADVPVMLPENVGFAPGMNAGLAASSGRYVIFVNNDTRFPPGWAPLLLETAQRYRGITTPAVTAAGGPFGVRSEAGTEVFEVPPFRHLPSGVAYLTERATMLELGGWDEQYLLASREDLDLLFTFWVNGLSVALDTRVLVDHESSASVRQVEERDTAWDRNWKRFIAKWTNPDTEIPRLTDVDPALLAARRDEAATVATWMDRWYKAEEGRKALRSEVRQLEAQRRELERTARRMEMPAMARLWSRVRARVPGSVRNRLFPYVRGLYYRAFPAGRADD